MDIITQIKQLCRAHSLGFKDCGNGHVQIIGKGALVNYWPHSKKLTAHVVGGESVKHCQPYDAVKLALVKTTSNSRVRNNLKPRNKSITKKGPSDKILKPISMNLCGLKQAYQGDVPPWDDSLEGFQFESTADLYRWRAKQYEDNAIRLRAISEEITP